ncbi:hypothetical protein E2562_000912 [Oryza meyeriana var. granulata]|uniref:Uncharacterized protein n=1 Tax=Oryza meyeriana var. granulata TaxID=110450 RepID=A0A6G1D058_9ORYZ|nr:hypothetical protein E2562_000912 [Oryza meyeriana var. granulata]
MHGPQAGEAGNKVVEALTRPATAPARVRASQAAALTVAKKLYFKDPTLAARSISYCQIIAVYSRKAGQTGPAL